MLAHVDVAEESYQDAVCLNDIALGTIPLQTSAVELHASFLTAKG